MPKRHRCRRPLSGELQWRSPRRAEQQISVDLPERLPGMRIEQRDGCSEQALLVRSRSGTAMSSVAQIREVARER
jgi:hypothetical protein